MCNGDEEPGITPIGEQACYQTADACYKHLLSRENVDPRRIVIAGRSLGGAVAIDLASRLDVAGLVAFSTFTRMSEMASRRYPFVPASLLLRHRFGEMDALDAHPQEMDALLDRKLVNIR